MTLHLRRIVRNRIAMLHFEYSANEQKNMVLLEQTKNSQTQRSQERKEK